MKGLFGKKGFQIELRNWADAPVSGHMVRIRPFACGVCGTDLHFLRDMEDFTPLGHEISAKVEEIGPMVTRVKPGDYVICEDVTMCGACEACKNGNPNLCQSGHTLEGQPGMADALLVHENMLNIYEGIDPITATMVEPLAVAIRGVDMLQLRPFDSIAIFGMGAIGQFCAAYARSIGAGRIAMFARNPHSQRNRAAAAAALDLGADEIYYTADADYAKKALEKGAFHAAIVAAPPSLSAQALDLLGYGGKALVMGVSFGSDASVELNISDMVFHKKQLLTSVAEPALNFPLAIQLIRSGRIDAARIITHRLRLEEADSLAELYGQDAPAIKSVIICN